MQSEAFYLSGMGGCCGDEFEPELTICPRDAQTEILALARLLQQFGPRLGRPHVDTLDGSAMPT